MTGLIVIILLIVTCIYITVERMNKHAEEFSCLIKNASNYAWIDLRSDAVHDLYINNINEGPVEFIYHDTENIWFIHTKNGKSYYFHLLYNYNCVVQGLVKKHPVSNEEFVRYKNNASLTF